MYRCCLSVCSSVCLSVLCLRLEGKRKGLGRPNLVGRVPGTRAPRGPISRFPAVAWVGRPYDAGQDFEAPENSHHGKRFLFVILWILHFILTITEYLSDCTIKNCNCSAVDMSHYVYHNLQAIEISKLQLLITLGYRPTSSTFGS